MRDWKALLTQFDPEAAARYREAGWWRDRLLVEYVEDVAAEAADRTAVIDARGEITYGELGDQAEALASGLTRLGVTPGAVVSAQLPNWHEAVVLAVACSQLGAVLNTISPIFRERDIATMLRLAEPTVLIVPDAFNGFDHAAAVLRVLPALARTPSVAVIGAAPEGTVRWTDLLAGPAVDLPARPHPDDVAQLAFTSGTTGEPKGVLHTHNTLIASASSYDERYEIGPEDVIHMASTVGHQTGILFGITCPIVAGSAAVLQQSWNPVQFVELVEKHRISLTNGAIPFLTDTLHADNLDGQDMSSLRVFSCIGAGLPQALAEEAGRRLPTTKLVGGWGMTETGLAVTNLLTDTLETVCTVDGRPVPGAELRILDEMFVEDLPAGSEGHLVVRGPQRHLGFLQPGLSQANFLEGDWYVTGDRGYLTEAGDFVMTTRSKDIIVRGGENIPVAEVENLLLAHPSVAMVAVVAVPDERLGEKACACVRLEPGASFDFAGMEAWLRDHQLTKQFWPEYLKVLEGFPTTPSGKIQKFVLRDRMVSEVTAS
ncbi:hypothetical protein GCM10022237_06170 [Nocardioides ginsengisoli]|uniref:AMP-binding protein n=1 Tax=Nocardioides ginsengisoli TaxID=363868 RepID=A0ABW3VY19_9ACTN